VVAGMFGIEVGEDVVSEVYERRRIAGKGRTI
jgi:hypothetical protein